MQRLVFAQEHIARIDGGLRAFANSEPFAKVVEMDSDGFEIHKIRLTADIPDAITVLTCEAIEALCSALNQATGAIAVACGSKHPEAAQFPVAGNVAEFEDILDGRLADFPARILAIFRGIKPYRGGNEPIWGLHRIRGEAMDRLIVPLGVAVGGGFIQHITVKGQRPVDVLTNAAWDAERREVEVLRTGPGVDPDYSITVALLATFGPVEGLAGRPVVATLGDIASEIEQILMDLEQAATELGLIA
jgi:hypothetical protein